MNLHDIPRAPERLTLSDLRPKKIIVSLSGDREVEVTGLSTEDVADLMDRHEPLRKILEQKAITAVEIIKMAPSAVKAIIAAGCGLRGAAWAEKAAEALTIEDQSEIIEGIARATFTRGFGPFVLRITRLGIEVSAAGKDPAMGLPRTSPPSFSPVSPRPGYGASPPASSPPMSSSPSVTASAA